MRKCLGYNSRVGVARTLPGKLTGPFWTVRLFRLLFKKTFCEMVFTLGWGWSPWDEAVPVDEVDPEVEPEGAKLCSKVTWMALFCVIDAVEAYIW